MLFTRCKIKTFCQSVQRKVCLPGSMINMNVPFTKLYNYVVILVLFFKSGCLLEKNAFFNNAGFDIFFVKVYLYLKEPFDNMKLFNKFRNFRGKIT